MKYVLYFYVSTFHNMCAVPNMAVFFYFLNFVFSWYVAQVLSEWVWNGSSRPYCYQYYFYFHFLYMLTFCYEIFIFKNLLSLFLHHISVSRIATFVNTHVSSFCYHGLRCPVMLRIVRSVHTCWFHNKVTFTFMTCFDWFWYMVTPLFVV